MVFQVVVNLGALGKSKWFKNRAPFTRVHFLNLYKRL